MIDEKTCDEISLVVGIGASAGGLAALKEFFEELPADTGFVFLVVQHLDPTHASMLAEILDRKCRLSVKEAVDGERLEANRVYTIPPDAYLEIVDQTIRVIPPTERRGFRNAVDHLFRSLADVFSNRAVGIVLSGAGSDGTAGLRAIKAGGGLVLAQNPESAEYASMPQSAIGTGIVDRVMEAKAMAGFIHHYSVQPYVEEAREQIEESFISKVATLLSEREDFDLGPYKDTTVGRRLCRRISLSNVASSDDYLDLIRENDSERRALMRDLLINVTDFLRDGEAFEALDKTVIPGILESADEGGAVRIWVAGCATGEEAYSIAILFWEKILQGRKSLDLKIFATDVDDEAITIARRGLYPSSSLEIFPPDLREKYFREEREGMMKIASYLRDKISFATQNLFADPPFSRMDLISCRNVLIYLRPETQARILNCFGFALSTEGFLFLGSSESVGEQSRIFRQISAKWRIYQRRPEVKSLVHAPLGGKKMQRSSNQSDFRKRTREKVATTPGAQEILLQQLDPSLVIDEDNQIVYAHGDLGGYLRFPEGAPKLDLMSALHPELRGRIRGAAFKARRDQKRVVVHPPQGFVERLPEKGQVRIHVIPVEPGSAADGTLIVKFDQADALPGAVEISPNLPEQERMVDSLERELAQMREELLNVSEELETSSEELKASHEEALSTNEELQSANEELEASTEELRSLNEELTTVNSQLKEKIDQLQSSNDYQQNLFTSTNIATLFLNGRLELAKFTPAAERLLQLGSRDIGHPMERIGHELVGEREARDAAEVMASLESSQRDIETEDGRWFTRKILPFKTEDQRIDGVVITYFEITQLRNAMSLLEASEERHSLLAKLGVEALAGRPVETLQHEMVREIAHALDCDFAKILKYEPDEERFLLVAGTGWNPGLVGTAYVANNKGSQAGYTMMENDAVIVDDLRKERRFTGPDLLLDHGVVSGISCVIENGGYPYGVLAVHSRERREFTREEATFLTSVANLLSVAVHRQRAESEVKQGRDRLDMAREAAQIGIHDHDLRTNTVSWDAVIRNIWGVPEDLEPISLEVFKQGLHPDDLEKTLQAIKDASEDPAKSELRIEYRVIHRVTSEVKWVEATGTTRYEGGVAVRIIGTVQDITERKQVMLELAAKEEKLRMARDSNRLGAFEISHWEERTNWDPLLLEIWGLAPGEVPTQEVFWEGVHPEDKESTSLALEAAMDPAGDGHYHAVYRVINRIDGKLRWVEASGQTLFNGGEPERMIGMVIDITEKKELEASLQAAVEKLETADEAKDRFLATLGHELRNPLMVVSMGVSVIERDPSKLDRLLDSLRSNINQISSLLDDLLDLTRITRGKLRLEMEPIELTSFLRDQIEGFRTKSSADELQVRYEDFREPIWIKADANRLGQVLGNLFTNACKFSEEDGAISISLGQDQGRATIKFIDSGVGIAEENLEKIFDPFEQVGGGERGNPGLGIGLSLVRELVEKHGGSVRAASEGEGKGATFTVEIPCVSDPQEPIRNPEPDDVRLRPGLRILIVDDNLDAAEGLASILLMEGCDVVQSHTTAEALASLEKFQAEVLLIDIGLGNDNGCDLLREIVERHGKEPMKVAITGFGHDEARQKTALAGFDHHINKPPEIKSLIRLISTRN